jgi:hypothetical protein
MKKQSKQTYANYIMLGQKAMGFGAMFVLLVFAVVVLPIIVRYINTMEPHFVASGFEDLRRDSVKDVPAVSQFSQSQYVPDPNTNYMCNSVNGQPCPEGTFCDGPTNQCVPIATSSKDDVVGYSPMY